MSTQRLPPEELTLDLIDRINAIDVDQSITLPNGKVITCRKDTAGDDNCYCKCALYDLWICDVIACHDCNSLSKCHVHFELTGALPVDNSTQPNKEEDHA